MAIFFENAQNLLLGGDDVSLYLLGESALVLSATPVQQRRLLGIQRSLAYLPMQMVLGVGNLTCRFDPLSTSVDELAKQIVAAWQSSDAVNDAHRLIELPVYYGGVFGIDLPWLAQQIGLSESEVIARHAAVEYDVLCIGFLPGFPYLAGLPAELACPRRASPRLKVPAGSVGIGGAQTGVYPCESPGGWHLIGHCPVPLFDTNKSQPSLLQAGDRVRFIPESPR